MANTTLSPIMSMPVPVPGTDPGPQYAFDLNSCLSILDQHDHTPGLGNPITVSAMNINSDLPMGSHNIINLRSARFDAQPSPLGTGSDLGCIYVSGVDLWYNDESGNQIQITALGGVAGTPGSIANLVSPASASYVALSDTFVFQSDVNQGANIDGASFVLRNIPGTFGLTLSPPALGSNYTITLPTLPSVPSFVSIDASGGMGDAIPLSQGLTGANIANSTITGSNIDTATITESNMGPLSVGTPELIDNSVTQDKLAAVPVTASGDCGTFTTTSSTPVLITGQSITLTSTGRPFMAVFEGTNALNSGFSIIDASNPPLGFITFYINGVLAQQNRIGSTVIGATFYFPGNLVYLDSSSPGSVTIEVKAHVTSSPTTVLGVTSMRIFAYEL